jgi:hypothetical protein
MHVGSRKVNGVAEVSLIDGFALQQSVEDHLFSFIANLSAPPS